MKTKLKLLDFFKPCPPHPPTDNKFCRHSSARWASMRIIHALTLVTIYGSQSFWSEKTKAQELHRFFFLRYESLVSDVTILCQYPVSPSYKYVRVRYSPRGSGGQLRFKQIGCCFCCWLVSRIQEEGIGKKTSKYLNFLDHHTHSPFPDDLSQVIDSGQTKKFPTHIMSDIFLESITDWSMVGGERIQPMKLTHFFLKWVISVFSQP